MTAALLAEFIARGEVALSDPIAKLLPPGTPVPSFNGREITIADIVTHTSGLQAETDGDWWERSRGGDWASLLASGVALRFTPGTTFHYSNTGYAVLGELIARLPRPAEAA